MPAVVVAGVVLVAASCGDDDTPTTEVPPDTSISTTSTSSTTTVAPETTTTGAPETTTTTSAVAPVGDCSADALAAPPTPEVLPGPVADTFRAIVDAAVACDYVALAEVAGDDITLSFGGHDDVAEFLESGDEREGLLRILVKLMAMPPGHILDTDDGADLDIWVWPGFWADDEPATAEERAAAEEIYGESFDELTSQVGYLNHRVGIHGDGDWLSFVAGD